MTCTLKRGAVTAEIETVGAELTSLRRGDCEYLWQGDPTYWASRAPVLFPICGRLYRGVYQWKGNSYEMNIHGFVRKLGFTVAEKADDIVTMTLCSDDRTRAIYPFDFILSITYSLDAEGLNARISVRNTGNERLPFAFGAHPGFRVPLEPGLDFTDYRITFSRSASPAQLCFSETCFQTGREEPFALQPGKILPLRHDLFDNDAIFLKNVGEEVTLTSPRGIRGVRVSYPEFPYLGLWHRPKSDAPYVCIEPWTGLPSFDGVVDDLETKTDLFRLPAGETKELSYRIGLL